MSVPVSAVLGLVLVIGPCCLACCSPDAAAGAPPEEVPAPGAPPGTEQEWQRLKAEIRRRFPGVPQLSIEDYAELGASPGGAPLLVDVRPAAEREVSWIPGSMHVPVGEGFERGFEGVPRDREIVLYCSVGWRSSEAAAALQRAGFTRVRNLEGSIFAWANQGRPLVDADGPARQVHPFDERWGRLLRAPLRAPR